MNFVELDADCVAIMGVGGLYDELEFDALGEFWVEDCEFELVVDFTCKGCCKK